MCLFRYDLVLLVGAWEIELRAPKDAIPRLGVSTFPT